MPVNGLFVESPITMILGSILSVDIRIIPSCSSTSGFSFKSNLSSKLGLQRGI